MTSLGYHLKQRTFEPNFISEKAGLCHNKTPQCLCKQASRDWSDCRHSNRIKNEHTDAKGQNSLKSLLQEQPCPLTGDLNHYKHNHIKDEPVTVLDKSACLWWCRLCIKAARDNRPLLDKPDFEVKIRTLETVFSVGVFQVKTQCRVLKGLALFTYLFIYLSPWLVVLYAKVSTTEIYRHVSVSKNSIVTYSRVCVITRKHIRAT